MRNAYLICVVALVAAVACQPEPPREEIDTTQMMPTPTPMEQQSAVADIRPASGSDLTGRAVFTGTDGQVQLELTVENASPGTHGVHIHEFGDCSAEDASSAGGHWNPTGEDHGRWGEPPFHSGDIGNIEVGEDGTGTLTMATDLWSIGGAGTDNIIGKSIVVHAGADDFVTQPAGDSGDRVGCGVIELGGMGGMGMEQTPGMGMQQTPGMEQTPGMGG